MMMCENYIDEKCRYKQALIGTNEDLPSGCDENGSCIVDSPDFGGEWFMVDPEDCDMLDLEERDEEDGGG